MEFSIMKCLFVLMGIIPIAKRMDIFKKKVKFIFPVKTEVSEEDMNLLRPIIEEGEKKI